MGSMNFQPADTLSLILFSLFALVMAFFIFKTIRRTTDWKKWTTLLLALIALFSGGALSGVVARHFLPLGPIFFLLMLVLGLSFSFSRSGRELAQALPFSLLIGFQGFRLPLELILHRWAEVGTIPETMTWTGQNWDIVSGIVALLCGPFVNKNRTLAIAANSVGLILLINVFRVVIMSLPLPFSWPLTTPLILPAYFPYTLIVPLFVLPALVGHLLTFQKLWKRGV